MNALRTLALGMVGLGWLGWGAAQAASAPAPDGSPTAAPNTVGTPQTTTPPGSPSAAQDLWQRDSLLGDLGGARSTLKDHGIIIAPVYTGEVMGNPTGGASRGLIYDHSLNVPLDIDFSRLVPGWEGATFHANALWIAGPSLSGSHIGDIGDTSSIDGYNTVRLQELWYQQNFLKDRISLKLGEIAADTEFFTSNTAAVFSNSAFGTMNILGPNLPDPHQYPNYPMAAPGVRLRVLPVDQVYVQVGVFDGNTESQSANPHGTDFHVNSESGAFIVSEAGYLLNQTPGADGLQGTYKFGAFVHTHDFDSWASQASGTPASKGADYGLYGIADQQLYARDGRVVSLFTHVGHAPANVNAVEWYTDGGFNFTGFVPGRAKDIAGVAVSWSKFSGDYSDAQIVLNGTRPYDAETVIEATYQIQLAPWWNVQPDFQYIFTPGGMDGSRDAAVLGLRTAITF